MPKSTETEPTFFQSRNVPDAVVPPDVMYGVYAPVSSESGSTASYRTRAILTSEGWVPPVDRTTFTNVCEAGGSPNDVDAIRYEGNQAVIVADPREMRDAHPDATITDIPIDLSPAAGHPEYSEISYYIPDGLSDDELSDYLWRAAHQAFRHKFDKKGSSPDADEWVEVLTDWFGVTDRVAKSTIRKTQDYLSDS